MKPTMRAALAAAIALAFSGPGLAADEPVKPPRAKAPAKPAARQPAKPVAKPEIDPEQYRGLTGQVIYQILLGEIALQRGSNELAVNAYGDLAYRTRDPKVLERTIEVASIARRFDVAFEAARLWLEIEPESVPARQTLTAVLIMQDRAAELGPHLSLLLEKDKENLSENLMRLNRMLARLQDKAAMYRMLEQVLVPYAGIAEAHYALATAAFHAGDRTSALMEIRKATALRPDWEAAALFESQLMARESTAAAVAVLERFLDANPKSREVRLHMARGLIAEKRYGEAKKHFDRLLADFPGDRELYYPAAVLALQQNDPASAEPLLQKVLETGDASERPVAAFYLGQIAEEKAEHAKAIGYYKQVGISEHFAPAQVRVAHLLLKEGGGLPMARAHLQESARRYPTGQAQFSLAEAHLLRDAGRDEEAFQLFDQIVKQQPNQPDVLYDAALLAEKLGRMDVVEANLRRVIELRPDNAHAYNALGYSFADRGVRLEEARTLIARALELAPGDPYIMDSMGWVLFRLGDMAAALEHLQKAYAIKQDAEIAAHLGEVLWMQGRQDEARKLWNDAAKKHPDNDVLKAVRRKFSPQ